MIHIITNHHKTFKWFDIQARYLKENTTNEYRVYCGASDMSADINLDERDVEETVLDKYIIDTLDEVENYFA